MYIKEKGKIIQMQCVRAPPLQQKANYKVCNLSKAGTAATFNELLLPVFPPTNEPSITRVQHLTTAPLAAQRAVPAAAAAAAVAVRERGAALDEGRGRRAQLGDRRTGTAARRAAPGRP
uniref:Uncharacterized protein n=1 Tax=Oryza barthii TaxID=65489 RepID=A0A0D3GDB5_9ORYZ